MYTYVIGVLYMCLHVYHVYMYTYVCLYVYGIYMHAYACLYVCVILCVYRYTCVYTHIHTKVTQVTVVSDDCLLTEQRVFELKFKE